MSDTRYYWNKSDQTFAKQGLGADITEHFADDIDEKGAVKKGSRLGKYLSDGYVVTEEPHSPIEAEENELVQLRKTCEEQAGRIGELEAELASVKKKPAKKAVAKGDKK